MTLHLNAPAEGLWNDGDDVKRDYIVVVEVMTEDVEREWWAAYRSELEKRLSQEKIIVRANGDRAALTTTELQIKRARTGLR
ncbi:hypothetical protein [Neorhizobium petrolearium]|uniref:hypothetical protein n=1 Tax=Neorhizobium petrolearium TaxID=515361 RepID=UPI003F5CC86A